MQIILVLETRNSCESDYYYVKSAIDYFYFERSFKISKLFAKTKSELINKDKRIALLKERYHGQSVVFICADYDRDDDPLNKKIEQYCLLNSFELVWMNLDVEEVFLGKQIYSKMKKKEAFNFLTYKNSIISSLKTLNVVNPTSRHPASNLLILLDKYLKRKREK